MNCCKCLLAFLFFTAPCSSLLAQTLEKPEKPQKLVFELKFLRTEDMAKLLGEIYPTVKLHPAPQTNQLIAVFESMQQAKEFDEVLKSLDVRPKPQTFHFAQAAGTPPAASAHQAASPQGSPALALARQIRDLDDDSEVQGQKQQLETQLRKQVAAEFQQRQQSQQAELAALRKRLARVEQILQRREQNREKIIERRVQELLDPTLQWNVDAAEQSNDAIPPAATPTNDPNVTPHPRPTASSAPAPVAPPTHSKSALLAIQRRVEATQRFLDSVRAEYRAGEATQLQTLRAEADYERAKLELDEARRQYEGEKILLQLTVEEATVGLQLAEQEFARAEALRGRSMISESELERLRANLIRAQIAVQRAKVQLDLHEGKPTAPSDPTSSEDK